MVDDYSDHSLFFELFQHLFNVPVSSVQDVVVQIVQHDCLQFALDKVERGSAKKKSVEKGGGAEKAEKDGAAEKEGDAGAEKMFHLVEIADLIGMNISNLQKAVEFGYKVKFTFPDIRVIPVLMQYHWGLFRDFLNSSVSIDTLVSQFEQQVKHQTEFKHH